MDCMALCSRRYSSSTSKRAGISFCTHEKSSVYQWCFDWCQLYAVE
jgi:hypothetical protein